MLTTFSLETAGTDIEFTYELESEKLFGIFGAFLVKIVPS